LTAEANREGDIIAMRSRRANEFVVVRTSRPEWHSDQPCHEAAEAGSVPYDDESVKVWTVEFADVSEVLVFVAKHGRCILLPNMRDNFCFVGSSFEDWPGIEIYDTYRE
jgi:hypothetical protein